MEANGGSGGAAPTGCYKCGRPGHWSRDCPSNPNSDRSSNKPAASSHPFKPSGASVPPQKQPVEKPKKAPKTRPKLTPELLLSDDGLGFVLRHFPKAFKFRGPGHETNDLGNLLSLYAEWHSHLIPYYSFNQFVHKVEQVGGSKRVKVCINDLRERVANGGDPTKLHETPEPHENPNHEQVGGMNPEPEEVNLEEEQEDTLPTHDEPDDFQQDMLHEIFENTIEGSGEMNNEGSKKAAEAELSEEVKARIEQKRLQALEKAAARKRALQSQPSSSS